MGTQSANKMEGVESAAQHFVKKQQHFVKLIFQRHFCQAEIIFPVEYVQVGNDLLVGYVLSADSYALIQEGQGIPHGSVGFLGNDLKGILSYGNTFLHGDPGQMAGHSLYGDPVKIEYLAAGQNRRQDLVLFCSSQNKKCIGRRLFKGFEECIEGRLGQHVYLVYDIDAVFANLGRDPDLVNKFADVIHRIVGSRIEFMNGIGTAFRKRNT